MASTVAPRRTLTYGAARAQVLGALSPLPLETVPLAEARRRALRTRIVAPHGLPPFRNSSMDGYAVHAVDLAAASAAHPLELPVVAVIAAGAAPPRPLARGEAMRIMTGAELPPGADAIVPFEETDPAGIPERPRFVKPSGPGANVREADADLAAGAEVFPPGRELSPYDLALLAGLGIARVEVGRRPQVAVLSTGDELLAVEAPLRPGAIRDSNSVQLCALIEEAGCQIASAERVSDDPDTVLARLEAALDAADVVLTIGGISMGDFDPVKVALARLGGVEWWRVAMKPGQPQAFGTPRGKTYFGLPGNPASVACVFEALVRPALRSLTGFAALDRPRLGVRAAEAIESRRGRTDFVRATLAARDREWWATPAGAQVSGHLVPQSRAHALLVVPEAAERLAAGDPAEALILEWPVASGR